MAASTVAISTYKTYLMYSTSTTPGAYTTLEATEYKKLCDIKSFPDLGGEPERVDVTTLSDGVRKYVQGVQDLSSFSFNANYIAKDYKTINDLGTSQCVFAIFLGANSSSTPSGENGIWSWEGSIMVYKAGGDVNAAQDMTIVAFPTTDFHYTVTTAE